MNYHLTGYKIMKPYSEDLFDRIAFQINLKPDTKSYESAKDVLVNGLTIRQAVDKHGVSKQLIHQTINHMNSTVITITGVEDAYNSGWALVAQKLLNELLEHNRSV